MVKTRQRQQAVQRKKDEVRIDEIGRCNIL
jgi:hypothetical protein